MESLPLPITHCISAYQFQSLCNCPYCLSLKPIVFPCARLQQRYTFGKEALSYLAFFSCQLFSWVVTSPQQSPRVYSMPCKLILPHPKVLTGCHWNGNNNVSEGEIVCVYLRSCIITIFCYWKSKYFKKLTFPQNSDKAGCSADRWTVSWHT